MHTLADIKQEDGNWRTSIQTEFKEGTVETVINLPQTGDSSNVFVYAVIALFAIAGPGLIIKKRN